MIKKQIVEYCFLRDKLTVENIRAKDNQKSVKGNNININMQII